MKLKKVRIIVESGVETKKRWEKALKGQLKNKIGEEIISVSRYEILGKVLSPQKLEILAVISALKPKSIADLSRSLKRDFKNVHSDVKFLANLGAVGPRFCESKILSQVALTS